MLIFSNLKEGLSRTVIPPIFKRVEYNYLKKKKKRRKEKKREREKLIQVDFLVLFQTILLLWV